MEENKRAFHIIWLKMVTASVLLKYPFKESAEQHHYGIFLDNTIARLVW